jgi:pyruvoyl-dependent arginine decarboxylase
MKRTTDTTLPGPKPSTAFPDVDRRRVLEGLTLVPTKIFFTKGVGSHRDELRSFELALKDAGIEKLNLVHVSSIYPPLCKIISKEEGGKLIAPGSIAFCVMARQASNEMRRLIAASIGCALPADKNTYGYLSEHHAYGQTDEVAGIRRGHGGVDARVHAGRRVRRECELGRERAGLQDFRRHRPDLQRDPVRRDFRKRLDHGGRRRCIHLLR